MEHVTPDDGRIDAPDGEDDFFADLEDDFLNDVEVGDEASYSDKDDDDEDDEEEDYDYGN